TWLQGPVAGGGFSRTGASRVTIYRRRTTLSRGVTGAIRSRGGRRSGSSPGESVEEVDSSDRIRARTGRRSRNLFRGARRLSLVAQEAAAGRYARPGGGGLHGRAPGAQSRRAEGKADRHSGAAGTTAGPLPRPPGYAHGEHRKLGLDRNPQPGARRQRLA